jgi:DNA (cytosine-5)-methyltransferase 1
MPTLVDLYCGAGGASKGYANAGWDVLGVDLYPQKNYPYEFIQMDALAFLDAWLMADMGGDGRKIDGFHASPPCQAFSWAQRVRAREHPDLIGPTRERLVASGRPWVIENVPGAPLNDPVMLCGAMFPGLRTYRHRLFETNFGLPQPQHPEHHAPQAKMGRPPKKGEFMHVVGHFSGVAAAREAMGIDWMKREELREALPPAYTEYVGDYMRSYLTHHEYDAPGEGFGAVLGERGTLKLDSARKLG